MFNLGPRASFNLHGSIFTLNPVGASLNHIMQIQREFRRPNVQWISQGSLRLSQGLLRLF